MSNDNDTGKYLVESIRLAMGNVKGRKQATWPFGAVLVKDGQVLGAVGVSGVKANEDAQVAKAGIAALGL